jgi:hypothetical protein
LLYLTVPLDEGYFSIILDNRPLIKGDTVAVPYFGHMLPLKVVDVEPEGTVIVTDNTKFMIEIGSMN